MYKLKDKIVNHFGNDLRFYSSDQMTGEIVFSNTILQKATSGKAFEISASKEKLAEECAQMLRHEILENYKMSATSWLPGLQELADPSNQPPAIVSHFLPVRGLAKFRPAKTEPFGHWAKIHVLWQLMGNGTRSSMLL